MQLTVAPCQQRCAWRPTGRTDGELAVLACAGCGSEWVRTQAWTPRDADGSEPPAVTAERAAGAAGRPDS